MTTKTTTHTSGNQTETKTYVNGTMTDIQHTNNKTGENHSHEPTHNPVLSSVGKRK